ncbi:MAG: hypothetical protein ACTSYA_06435 [Candidatus Kariarchaeaceae archaeon]
MASTGKELSLQMRKQSKSLKLLSIVFASIIFLSLNVNLKLVEADTEIITSITFSDYNLICDNEISLQMTNANVEFTINTNSKFYEEAYVDVAFHGIYRIYNPNVTTEVLIVNPISSFLNPSDLTFKVNGTPKTILMEDHSLYVKQTYDDFTGRCVVSNHIIESQTALLLEYSYNYRYEIDMKTYFNVIYEVGTANTWSGVITEEVIINTIGDKQPRSVTSNPAYEKSSISGGKSYRWYWENEVIALDNVSVKYSFGESPILIFTVFLWMLPLLILGTLTRKLIEPKGKDVFSLMSKNERIILIIGIAILAIYLTFFSYFIFIGWLTFSNLNSALILTFYGVLLISMPIFSRFYSSQRGFRLKKKAVKEANDDQEELLDKLEAPLKPDKLSFSLRHYWIITSGTYFLITIVPFSINLLFTGFDTELFKILFLIIIIVIAWPFPWLYALSLLLGDSYFIDNIDSIDFNLLMIVLLLPLISYFVLEARINREFKLKNFDKHAI